MEGFINIPLSNHVNIKLPAIGLVHILLPNIKLISLVSQLLNKSITYVKGVGPVKAEALVEEIGVHTLKDLLYLYPFRYVDKTVITPINSVVSKSEYVQIKGVIISKELVKGQRRSRLHAVIKDSSGIIELVWFQGVKWMNDNLLLNTEYLAYGKPNSFKGHLTITHPEMELSNTARASMEPVYHSTDKLKRVGFENKLRRRILRSITNAITSKDINENLPSYLLEKLGLIPKLKALKWIHFPPNPEALKKAEERIKFEEIFFFQMRILYTKQMRRIKFKGLVFEKVGKTFNRYYKEKIPFELTNAQKRVIKEIRADIGSGAQMNRLLQGDVGSGKTMVGLLSMLIALDNDYQCVMMAPTEILAQQHFQSITENIAGLGIKVAFLSGSVKGKTRAQLLKFLKSGDIDILIGTHAVLEDPVEFKNLGLAIIDEQHRFGVMQRSKLWRKGKTLPPHILVMTATPIPRTLAMTVYGDLEVSVIDELPPGRKLVKTLHKTEKHRAQIIAFLHEQIKLGRQAYIVYPLIDESAKLDLANLQEGYDRMLEYFPQPRFKMSIVHGRMKPADKDMEMQRFSQGKTQIMVATTVIEVGVNVPNATIMVIENTERFGLSQLHQLRGRVGRGAEQSFCILMSSYKLSKNAKHRIRVMTETNDGFRIAEEDLKLRGPGDISGTRQSGTEDFKLFNIIQDQSYISTARQIAIRILDNDPKLEAKPNLAIKEYLHNHLLTKADWGRIS